MIRIRLAELLEARGKTLYWLRKESGVSYPTLLRLAHNKIQKPELRVLEKVCVALGCEVGELLVIERRPRRPRKIKAGA